MFRVRSIATAICLVFLSSVAMIPLTKADWPMFLHDPAHTGYTTTEALTTAPAIIWRTPGEFEGVVASPAVVDDVVYINTVELFAFNASTGHEFWNVSGVGYGANPIVNGDFVYCGGIAFNASTGAELWSPNPPGASVPQALADGYLYAYAYDSSFPQVGSHIVALLRLNATTGAQIWRIPVDFVSTDPAVANGMLYIAGSKGTFYAIDAQKGNQVWSHSLSVLESASPAVYNGIVYIGSYDRNIYALNATNGAKIWNYTTGSWIESTPAVANGVVYISSDDGNFYALNATNGAKIWSYATSGGESSPAITGDVVYVGGWNGNLYALNASTGDKLWNYTVQRTGTAEFSGLHTSPAVVNGRVYISSNDYIMIVLGGASTPSQSQPSSALLPKELAIAVLVIAIVTVGITAFWLKERKQRKSIR